MNGIKIKKIFETFYPRDLAYEWDNVGCQIGSLNKEVNIILLSLDLTLEVVDEAISNKVELIIVHHPLIFSPIKSIDTDTYKGMLIEKLIKNEITLYVAHTNFDISNKGMNLILANMLNLKNQKILDYTTESEGLGRVGDIAEMSMEKAIRFV
ncbi:MAG: Nif3-like dinuclear metal center hexameric protein [Candidatus Izimaplasma sp.]|nr:Nif3-like dinuclear metal center hexameric protein [Candidatus Izimaplasma bacterium]